MKMKLVLDVDKCCACGACAVACMDQNDIDIAHMTPFRRVADFELNGEYLYTSVSCMHCDDAPCIQGCPVGVLRKDPVTNLTVYDNTNCIGCKSCALARPLWAPATAALWLVRWVRRLSIRTIRWSSVMAVLCANSMACSRPVCWCAPPAL